MTRVVRKKSRSLSIRLPEVEVSVIDRAAAIRGQSRSAFMREAALRAAEDAILDWLDSPVILMSPEGFDDFVKRISGPPQVVPAMVEFMKRTPPWESNAGSD